MNLNFGIDHFGDLKNNNYAQSLKDLVAQAFLADEVGISSYNLGEHHRDDYAVAAPEIVLSYIAAQTKNIKLGTGVVVLSSDDPVRIYERFAELDALSDHRMELTVGRGSFTESFPLFGYALSDYEELFEEKLAMLAEIWKGEPITWKGKHTQKLNGQRLYPVMDSDNVPLYVAVGGSPESVIRAAHYDLGLRLAVIGGDPARFAPFAELYRKSRERFEHTATRSIGFHSPGLIAETDEKARELFYGDFEKINNRIGAERGWMGMDKERFIHEVEHGALFVGSAETVAQKIAKNIKILEADTFNLKMGQGTQEAHLDSIRLYGEKVIPMVKDMLS